jgi:formylglycine-generating enzyme required for sulfatase activity
MAEDMVILEGGTFSMGSMEAVYADESPAHDVTVQQFAMDKYEVTNKQFAQFIAATGYITDAENRHSGWVYRKGAKDWEEIKGADWRHPEGPSSNIEDRMNHPVVQVSWNDASAFAEWAEKRLPTEAEWEYAVRGGRSQLAFPWGNKLEPGGNVFANFWQGTWPEENLLKDKYYYTSPAGSFSANDYGVHDMIGNVWEWCGDWYDEEYYQNSPVVNPGGPDEGTLRVARGGSWFCSQDYCGAYRNAYRGRSPQDASFNNVGFRCAQTLL